MKKIFLFLTAAALFTACDNDKKTEASTESGNKEVMSAAPAVPLSMTASYSSSFELGNPAYSAMIVQGSWKDWADNNMDNMKSWIADTIVAFHSDNSMVQGADSLMARWKTGRAKYSTVLDTIQAVIPAYSTDKKENWVLVWAKEINTDTKGKIDTAYLMETWRINKDGKADMLLQYDRAPRKK